MMNPKAYTDFLKGLQEKVKKAVEQAGIYVNPYEKARTAVFHIKSLIIVSLTYISSAIATYFLFGRIPEYFIALAATPLVIPPFIGVYLGTFDKVRERREKTEKELPFFTTLTAILARAGLTLYTALVKASSRPDIFPWMSREAMNIRRDSEALGVGITDAMTSRAEKHPSQKFKTFMHTATSIWRSGGDVAGTVEAFASQHLKELSDKWESYGRSVSGIAEMLTIIFILFPMSAGIIAVAFPAYSLTMVALIGVALIPAIAVICYIMVRNASPAIPDRYGIPSRIYLAFLPALIPIVPYVIQRMTPTLTTPIPMSALVGVACVASSILLYSLARPMVEEVSESERALIQFVRDVTELRRVGYTIMQALEKCLNNPYPKKFSEILRKAVARMNMGVSISDSVRDCRSWLLRVTFTLLEEAEESGGGNPDLLEKIESLLRTHTYSKERSRSGVKLYIYLTMFIPFIISFSSALMIALAGLMAPITGQGFGGIALAFAKPEEMRSVMDMVMVTTLESTICMGLIIGRAADQHPYGTWRIALSSLTFIAAAVTLPQMENLVSGMFGLRSGAG